VPIAALAAADGVAGVLHAIDAAHAPDAGAQGSGQPFTFNAPHCIGNDEVSDRCESDKLGASVAAIRCAMALAVWLATCPPPPIAPAFILHSVPLPSSVSCRRRAPESAAARRRMRRIESSETGEAVLLRV
jgi:hypothetical protein